MTDLNALVSVPGTLVFLAPAALVVVLGVSSLFDRKLSEAATVRVVYLATVVSLAASLGILAVMLTTDVRHVAVGSWTWVEFGGHGDWKTRWAAIGRPRGSLA